MLWLFTILLLAAGVLACSALIIGKKPEAKQLIDKLVPFQGIIGVVLLVICVLTMLQVGPGYMFSILKSSPVVGMQYLGGVFGGAALGLVFGMPLIAKVTGKDGSAIVQKLSPFQVILGLVCLGAGALNLLWMLGIHL
ncbi:MAG TPA: hypothetical protein VGM90_21435 [Kofleriaceae bacterium]|jgi:hypothetical protein